MIDVILDCKQNDILKQYLQSFLNIRFIGYQDIKQDFLLIKEIEKNKDLDDLKILNNLSYQYALICLISNEKHILDLMEIHQAYFINKNTLSKHLDIIDDCLNNFKNSKSLYIEITSNYEKIIINIHSILYIELYGHDIIIHTLAGEFRSRQKLSSLFQELEYYEFIQIHKSYIVNKNAISHVTSKQVTLNNSIHLLLGRKYKKAVKELLTHKKYPL